MAGNLPPVIAIDGPSASGKGTVAERVARDLGFHYLDSGALYRLLAWAALDAGINLENESGVSDISLNLNVIFNDGIWLNQKEVGAALREEAIGNAASRVAALPRVRQALLARQRAFRQPPGLVADGRDMGSVVFPDARLKIYLTATPEARADRRYKQLMDKGMGASMNALLQDIRDRDARDSARAVAPLQKCSDAMYLDTTALTIDEVVAQVLAQYKLALQVP
ncbi:MAG: (d)CMP kinase [Burkholderiales bacterium]|nr:(d)CMP kinase [Burkholderiales bacterium]